MEKSSISDSEALTSRAWAAEEALLRGDTRRDAGAVDRLLADDFHEIGQSGRHWTRAETVAELASGDGVAPGNYAIADRRTDRVADGVILLSYLLEFEGRASRRSSLWTVRDGELKLMFHQGTSCDQLDRRIWHPA